MKAKLAVEVEEDPSGPLPIRSPAVQPVQLAAPPRADARSSRSRDVAVGRRPVALPSGQSPTDHRPPAPAESGPSVSSVRRSLPKESARSGRRYSASRYSPPREDQYSPSRNWRASRGPGWFRRHQSPERRRRGSLLLSGRRAPSYKRERSPSRGHQGRRSRSRSAKRADRRSSPSRPSPGARAPSSDERARRELFERLFREWSDSQPKK